jgi:hypothetical protein
MEPLIIIKKEKNIARAMPTYAAVLEGGTPLYLVRSHVDRPMKVLHDTAEKVHAEVRIAQQAARSGRKYLDLYIDSVNSTAKSW